MSRAVRGACLGSCIDSPLHVTTAAKILRMRR